VNELNEAERALYDDKQARPDFYKPEWNFDPLQYLRKTTDEEGRIELSLDIKYRRHWFRLVYPHGQVRIHEKTITKEAAMFTIRIYADKNDDPENFLAEGTAIRYYGTGKQYERYYVDWTETMATGRALTSAGFDVPWCNRPTENGVINLYTGETITYDDESAPGAGGSTRKYPDVTAPPDEQPAHELPGQQQLEAPAAQATQTPAQQQAAQAPTAPQASTGQPAPFIPQTPA